VSGFFSARARVYSDRGGVDSHAWKERCFRVKEGLRWIATRPRIDRYATTRSEFQPPHAGNVNSQTGNGSAEDGMPKQPSKPPADADDAQADRELDEQLEDTFPASDPPKVTRVPRQSQIIGDDEGDKGSEQGR
jgi:hypothetical protein